MQRMWSVAALSFLVALLSVGLAHAQELSGADLAEIHHLHSKYNQGTDFENAEMWLGVFTDDAVFRIVYSPENVQEHVGRDALRQWRMGNFSSRQPGRQYRHWNSSWVITPTDDGGATGRVYWMGFDPTAAELAISDTGYYDDVYVKTADGWRIKRRQANADQRQRN